MSGVNLENGETLIQPVQQVTRTWNFTWPKWWHWYFIIGSLGAILITIAFIARSDLAPDLFINMMLGNFLCFTLLFCLHAFAKFLSEIH